MTDLIDQLSKIDTRLLVLGLYAKLLCELVSVITKGGGLVNIGRRFLFGENIPKVIADDYKAELFPNKHTTDEK